MHSTFTKLAFACLISASAATALPKGQFKSGTSNTIITGRSVSSLDDCFAQNKPPLVVADCTTPKRVCFNALNQSPSPVDEIWGIEPCLLSAICDSPLTMLDTMCCAGVAPEDSCESLQSGRSVFLDPTSTGEIATQAYAQLNGGNGRDPIIRETYKDALFDLLAANNAPPFTDNQLNASWAVFLAKSKCPAGRVCNATAVVVTDHDSVSFDEFNSYVHRTSF